MQLAIAPIGWANDDIRSWGGERTGEEIMAEVARAGYAGSEMSYKYPQEPGALRGALAGHGLALSGAYRWTNLAHPERAADEVQKTRAHLDFCRRAGARFAILAEGYRSLHWDLDGERREVAPLDAPAWDRLVRGLHEVLAAAQGLTVCYHVHGGTAIERRPDFERLFERVPELRFCLDTAQLAYAGEDPEEVARDFRSRIPYVHLKDVRPRVLDRVHLERPTFLEAVRQNLFCTPGQGGLDFPAILGRLDLRQDGWLVVEADQDPAQNPPYPVAEAACRYLKGLLEVPA